MRRASRACTARSHRDRHASTCCRQHAPDAVICIDPYRAVQVGNRALDEGRRGYWNHLRDSDHLGAGQALQGRSLGAAEQPRRPHQHAGSHRAYGFHSPDALIAMIYLCCSNITINLPDNDPKPSGEPNKPPVLRELHPRTPTESPKTRFVVRRPPARGPFPGDVATRRRYPAHTVPQWLCVSPASSYAQPRQREGSSCGCGEP